MAKKSQSASICINITSTLNQLELLQYDVSKGNFVHLDSEEFMFDPATREMLDQEDSFKTSIKRLFDRNKIPVRSQTSLVVPSFFTRQYVLPEGILAEDLQTILVSEAERFYVFKKIDPSIGYCTIKDGQILYTAYPKQSIDIISRVFSELKIPLSSIDCNYTAILRGLLAMGVVQEEVANNLKWGMLVISDFNVFMTVVAGGTIEKTLESPLSLQNNEESSLMGEIRDDFKQFYGYEVLNRLVVINNSLKIYSTTLIEALQFEGQTSIFDQNEHTLASLGAKDSPFPCSLEAIGGALVNVMPMVPALELCDPSLVKANVDENRKNMVAFVLIGIGLIILGLQWSLGAIIDNFAKGESQKGSQLQTEIHQKLSSLAIIPEVKRKMYIKKATFQNYRISNFIIQVAQHLPADAWLTEISIDSKEDLKNLDVTIKGGALTSDPLNSYVQSLASDIGSNPLSPAVIPKQEAEQRYFEYTLANTKNTGSGGGSP